MEPYRVLVSIEILRLSKPSRRDRDRILSFLENLGSYPTRKGDYDEQDAERTALEYGCPSLRSEYFIQLILSILSKNEIFESLIVHCGETLALLSRKQKKDHAHGQEAVAWTKTVELHQRKKR